MWQRLIAEHGASLSEVTVSRYLARRRIELGAGDQDVFVPQVHEPGAEAEVDLGEFDITIAGVTRLTIWAISAGGRFVSVVGGVARL